MAATTYDEQREYTKFLKKKAMHSEHGHHHEGCSDCDEKNDNDYCECCPPGLIAVYDDQNTRLGCLTPNDAELFNKNTFRCQDGYLRLIRIADGEFFGCVSEENFKDIYDNINGLSS
jgi:hypothetical protein